MTPDKTRKKKERKEKRAAGFLPHEVWVHKLDWPQLKCQVEALYERRMAMTSKRSSPER